jgi:predicted nucleic acid-binding protein
VRPEETAALERFSSGLVWIPLDEDVARIAGSLARRYRSERSGTDDADYLIAATAIAADADLLTTNVRHFPMFPNLRAPY